MRSENGQALTELTDQPQLTIRIGESTYLFSELPVAALAELQRFLEEHNPNPFDAVKLKLDGLEPEDRRYLLNEARKDALKWPPEVQGKDGIALLIQQPSGQVEMFYHALRVHQPMVTREDARILLRRMEKEAKDGTAFKQLLSILFSLAMAEDEEGLPKAGSPRPSIGGSRGASSSGVANAS